MHLKIRTKTYDVADLAEASRVYCAAREKSGLGASRFPSGEVFDGGRWVARVSFNGNVWGNREWTPGEEPLIRVAGLFN